MIRTITKTALLACCASAALLTVANAAPARSLWYECQYGWQLRQCAPDGVQITTPRARRVVVIPPRPRPEPTPEVAKFQIKPEGNGAVTGGGSGGGGGGGGGGR